MELTEWASQGDWRLYFVHRDRIEKVTAADVSKAAAKYLKPDNSDVRPVYPHEVARPHERADARQPGEADRQLQRSAGYRSGRGVRPQPGEYRQAHQDRNASLGGVKAALLERRRGVSEIHMRLELHYGDVKT